jgi:hypothetical protein
LEPLPAESTRIVSAGSGDISVSEGDIHPRIYIFRMPKESTREFSSFCILLYIFL